MNDTVLLAGHRYAHATALMVDELDTILSRILRNDPHLVLEQEAGLWWTVVDRANDDAVMMRAGRGICVRFMEAFARRHPEARVVLPEREDGSGYLLGGSVTREGQGPSSRSESTMDYSWRVAAEAAGPVTHRSLAPVLPLRPRSHDEVVAAAVAHLAGDNE